MTIKIRSWISLAKQIDAAVYWEPPHYQMNKVHLPREYCLPHGWVLPIPDHVDFFFARAKFLSHLYWARTSFNVTLDSLALNTIDCLPYSKLISQAKYFYLQVSACILSLHNIVLYHDSSWISFYLIPHSRLVSFWSVFAQVQIFSLCLLRAKIRACSCTDIVFGVCGRSVHGFVLSCSGSHRIHRSNHVVKHAWNLLLDIHWLSCLGITTKTNSISQLVKARYGLSTCCLQYESRLLEFFSLNSSRSLATWLSHSQGTLKVIFDSLVWQIRKIRTVNWIFWKSYT